MGGAEIGVGRISQKHGIVSIVMIVCEQRVITVYVSSGVNIDNHAICSCVYSVCQKTGHKNDPCKKRVERIHEVHKQIQNNQSSYGRRWAPTSFKYDYNCYPINKVITPVTHL